MIYLYVKTHNTTGLKYLGKTIQDPFVYKGSGLRWRNHLSKHGNNVSTSILFESNDPDEIRAKGEYYSKLWNIVNDPTWANLRPESGDGGNTSNSENYKNSMLKRNTSGNKNSMYGRSAVKEQNLKWYNNGTNTIYVPEGSQPDGYVKGRIIKNRKPHSDAAKKKLGKHLRKGCISPKGEIFDSLVSAAKQYNVSAVAIGALIKRGISGWRFL